MSETSKQDGQAQPDKVHAVRWRAEDWDRIVALTKKMAAEEHLDLVEADIIRKGTRALLESALGPKDTELVSVLPEHRSGDDRRKAS